MIAPAIVAAIALRFVDGVATVPYSVAPDTPFMNGNLPRMGRDVELLFEEPMDATHSDRVVYEAQGVQVDDRHHSRAVELRPIIEDEEGEVFDLLPQKTAMMSVDDSRATATGGCAEESSWREYATGCWFAGEAGAASHGLYTVSGAAGDERPTGRLRFVGFRLHVVREAPDGRADVPGYAERLAASKRPVEGVLRIAAVRMANGKVPFSPPFVFADALCPRDGRYRFSAAVFSEFQAPPVGGVDEVFEFRRGERRRLEVPTGPDGVYRIDWKMSAEKGAVVAEGSFRTQTLGADASGRTARTSRIPEVLRVAHDGRGVYARGEPFEMRVVGMKGSEVRYTLEPYAARDVLSEGTVPPDGHLAFERTPGVFAFRLRLGRMRDGAAAETAEFLFGERTDPADVHSRAGRVFTRAELKKRPFNRFTYHVKTKDRGQRNLAWHEADFVRFVEESRAWLQNYTISADLADFEVLPGVYDFTLLDRYMDIAADWGVKLTVKLDHADWYAGPYRWNAFSGQYSFDGSPCGYGNPCGVFAASDAGMRAFFARANRALFDRYRSHVAFLGYYVCQPASEFTVVDQPWMGSISGYSPTEERGFRDFVRAKYGTLASLNAAWGTELRSWDGVRSPPPDFRLGAAPDLSARWVDFSRWKQGLADSWYVNLLADIRAFDTNRVTIAYGRPRLAYAGLLDYAHNGGNACMDSRGEFVEACAKGGIGWITEPIHPHRWAAQHSPGAGGWTLDASVWTMLAQAGSPGANLHLYSFNESGEKTHFGLEYAHDRMRRVLPILEEVHGARLVQPAGEIATYCGWDTLLLKHRAYFAHRLADLRRWLELVEGDGLKAASLDAFPARPFKLVVPNALDEVIPAAAFSDIVRQVRDFGATCLMTVRTGRFVTEFGAAEEFPLLKAFGIPLPKGKWRTDGDLRAVAGEGNPLFDVGATIDFQTLTRLRREVRDPRMLANFSRYPYRWIPETDYFGAYADEDLRGAGRTLARFEGTGGAALSLHEAGRGRVLLFWGLPSQTGGALKGMMARAAAFAGVALSRAEVPDWFEMTDDASGRHYGFFYLETDGDERRLVFPNCPNGTFFADDMVSDHKYGLYSGKILRQRGIAASWRRGDSPLKAIRLVPSNASGWRGAYENDIITVTMEGLQ